MKIFTILLPLALLFCPSGRTAAEGQDSAAAAADDGEILFREIGCRDCHRLDIPADWPHPPARRLARLSLAEFSTTAVDGVGGTAMMGNPSLSSEELQQMWDWLRSLLP